MVLGEGEETTAPGGEAPNSWCLGDGEETAAPDDDALTSWCLEI